MTTSHFTDGELGPRDGGALLKVTQEVNGGAKALFSLSNASVQPHLKIGL